MSDFALLYTCMYFSAICFRFRRGVWNLAPTERSCV